MKTGIIGGTFDPIHNAHLLIAKKAYEEFGLDKILFMPTPNPPHKNEKEITPLEHRIKMIQLAIEDKPYFYYSDFEINREGVVYSADTLTLYKQMFPSEDLYFILGSDSLFSFTSWYKPDVITKKCTILVANRGCNDPNELKMIITNIREQFNATIFELELEESDISSTNIRQNIKNAIDNNYMPKRVADYILKNRLYTLNKGSKRFTVEEITEVLKETLSESRFEHVIGVANTAKKIAEALNENPNKAYLAGLLHDCAKHYSEEELTSFCKSKEIEIDEAEVLSPYLLHAKVGAYLCENHFHIIDEDIINSIRFHTTGRKNMSLLEKIIFVADYIEPSRIKQPNLSSLRELAYKDINRTMFLILRDTLLYLEYKGQKNIAPQTREAYEYYKKVIDN